MQIRRYVAELDAQRWDNFISCSNNATFLFYRRFMDYHRDRFIDHSLLIEDDNHHLVALFPATEHRTSRNIRSHGGLTYGGLLLIDQTHTQQVLSIMEEYILPYYRVLGFLKLQIKLIPFIYHRIPSEELSYALFRINAKLTARAASSVIDLSCPLAFSTLRKRKYKKAQHSNLQLVEGGNTKTVWEILIQQLQTHHKVLPVHNLEEIEALMAAFPHHIKMFTAQTPSEEIQAATLLFCTPMCVHAQYIVASPTGRTTGALDFLFIELLSSLQAGNTSSYSPRYFDFGISTEESGHRLNEGLIFQKEGFGARTVVYDQYEIDL